MLGNARSPHTVRFASAFAERGHELVLASIRAATIPGVIVRTVRWGPEGPNAKMWALVSYLRLLLQIRRIAREARPDVVHAHYSITHGAIATLARLRPRLVSVWGSDALGVNGRARGLKGLINSFVLPRANTVTVTSQFMLDPIRYHTANRTRVEHIPWGVDTRQFYPVTEKVDKGEFRIGFVKHLKSKYGPDVLVEAMRLILGYVPNAKLVLAGEGPLYKKLVAASRGFSERVEFLGRISHREVPALIRDFDVLVNPSVEDSETFGVVLLEAMSSGVPVVATKVGGVPEVVDDGRTGLLVPRQDASAVAGAVIRLANDPSLARQMGNEGVEHVRLRFNWAQTVDRMLEVLESVAKPHG